MELCGQPTDELAGPSPDLRRALLGRPKRLTDLASGGRGRRGNGLGGLQAKQHRETGIG